MICKNCGSNNQNDNKFCDQCGSKIEEEPRTELFRDIKNSKLNLFDIASIILGIISIISCILWYISIPIAIVGIICTKKADEKRENIKKDYRLLLNVLGIVFSSVIIVVSIIFGFLQKEYISDNYSVKYDINWNIDEKRKNLKIIYNENEDTYLSYQKEESFPENLDITSEEDRKKLFEKYYNLYKNNARAGAYYISTENEYFYKVKGTKDMYIAYISYSAYDGRYGKFYIVASKENDLVLTFRSYANNKYSDTIMHSKILKLLEKIEMKKRNS